MTICQIRSPSHLPTKIRFIWSIFILSTQPASLQLKYEIVLLLRIWRTKMNRLIFAIALSFLPLSARSQESIETKLDLGTPKIAVQYLGTDKFLVNLTMSPMLVSSNGAVEAAQGVYVSAQLGVWTLVGGRSSFFYLESSTPQQITADQSGKVDHNLIFSRDQLATQNAPICLSVLVNTQTGPGASRIVCAGQ